MSTAAESQLSSGGPAPERQYRVDFDAEVLFSNGGGLTAREFRLDLPASEVSDEELGELLVAHLGLLMVGEVRVTRKRVIVEPHKGSRGVPGADPTARRVVDVTGPDTAVHGRPEGDGLALVDLPVTLIRILGAASQVVDRVQFLPFDVRGGAVLIESDGPTRLTEAAARWLVKQGARVVGGNAGQHAFPLAELAGITVLSGLARLADLSATSARLHLTGTDVYAVASGL